MSVTLDEIRQEADPSYPSRVFAGQETALILFAAGFYGKQDAIHAADAGVRATCVDVDEEKIERMMLAYPSRWEFSTSDAFSYARAWRTAGRRWDVVSVDSFTNMFDRAGAEVQLWCDIARVAVVLGTGAEQKIVAPDGWRVTDTIQRSDFRGGVFWTVLERSWH